MALELISRLPDQPTDKPPLLFLHGMGFGAWCWDEHFLPWFAARGYPSYAMSLRGHGNSPLPAGQSLRWTKLSDYLEDVAEIYQSFDQPPILIGHSMGGYIMQKFLADYDFKPHGAGSLPPAVILLTTTPSNGLLKTALSTLGHFPKQALLAFVKGSARPLLDKPDIFKKTLLSDGVALEDIKRYTQLTGEESLRTVLTMLLASSPKRRDNPPPILVIGAQNDTYISAQETKNTALYYKADYTNLPNLAHLVMLDSQWESAAQDISEWLALKGL